MQFPPPFQYKACNIHLILFDIMPPSQIHRVSLSHMVEKADVLKVHTEKNGTGPREFY
jgi:hypothetical protein